MKFTKIIKASSFTTVSDFIEKLKTLDPNKIIEVHGNNGGHTNPHIMELKNGDKETYYVIVNEGNTSFKTEDIENFRNF